MSNEKLNINQWAKEDRPREKMMLHGPGALSNAELLAILIGSGNTEDSAVELMRKVLDDCRNSLSELGKRSVDDLCAIKESGRPRPLLFLPLRNWANAVKTKVRQNVSGCVVHKTFFFIFIP